jgi:hypothetical protein
MSGHLVKQLTEQGFVPFAFGNRKNLEELHPAPFGASLHMIAADDPKNLHYHHAINRLNGLAYGGKDMGMPAWVQIDCGILPSAFIGFALHTSKMPEKLKWQMDIHDDTGLVPVAEAISIPTVQPGRYTSFSMCSVIPGKQLGYAAKLMSLKAYGCRRTLGVAHTRFGALEIVEPHVPYHTCPENTFVYGCDLRGGSVLDVLEKGGVVDDDRDPSFILDARDTSAMLEMAAKTRAGTHRYWLLPPGAIRTEHGVQNPILEESL